MIIYTRSLGCRALSVARSCPSHQELLFFAVRHTIHTPSPLVRQVQCKLRNLRTCIQLDLNLLCERECPLCVDGQPCLMPVARCWADQINIEEHDPLKPSAPHRASCLVRLYHSNALPLPQQPFPFPRAPAMAEAASSPPSEATQNPCTPVKHLNVPYTSHCVDGEPLRTQCLDLTLAATTSDSPTKPLVVFIHGGLWVDRDKSGYDLIGTHWSSTLEVHVAVINYRLSSAGGRGLLHPNHTDDALLALRWLASSAAQQQYGFATDDIFLVGHSCGAHISGLITLADPSASRLTKLDEAILHPSSSDTSADRSLASLLRGCVGIEGIFDCARFAADFAAWSSGITDAFGAVEEGWESPQDYLPLPTGEDTSSASRQRVQLVLKGRSSQRSLSVPWLVIHSPEDPWVNLPQAERFVQSFNARAVAANAHTQSAAHAAESQGATMVAPAASAELVLVRGAHFAVVDRIGTEQDEITKPLQEFIRKCLKQ